MNLSIFSSENIRTYRSFPASRRRKHVGFVVLFVVLSGLSHWVANRLQDLEYREGPQAYLASARMALSERTQVVFLGSSHVIGGIRPDLFSFEAMNIAGAGFNYDILEKILRKNLDSIPNLKLAVIELDPVPLMFDASEYRKGDYRAFNVWGLNRNDIELKSKTLSEKLSDFVFDLLVPQHRLTPKSLWSFFSWRLTTSPKERQVVAGHKSRNHVLRVRTGIPTRIAWLDERFSKANLKRNREALQQIIALLLEHNVQIIFVQLPHYATHWKNTPISWRTALEETYIELQKTLNISIPFWDYEQSMEFDETHFMDSVHMNSSGAEIFSSLLDQKINAFWGLASTGR